MINKPQTISQSLTRKFHAGVRWNLGGSILYEVTKAVHNFFLLSVLSHAAYGLLGSTFSVIYFASKLADLGAATSLPPYFTFFLKDKSTFRRMIFNHYLLPHLPLVLVVATVVTIIYGGQFPAVVASPIVGVLLPIIISLECIRYFLRIFLHAAFKSRGVVIAEVTVFTGFLSIIWVPTLLFNIPLTLPHFLWAHLVDSLACVVAFTAMTINHYRQLPSVPTAGRRPSTRRLVTTKLLNYTLRLGRDLFSSHFLTPLFAIKCGLGPAGIFYFATVLVSAVQSTLKMSIQYPANALLANLKESTAHEKREAFTMMIKKLLTIGIPLFIFLTINYKRLLTLGSAASVAKTTVAITLLFLFISFLDLFIVLYEQFYIMEEASNRLLFFKLFEFSLFYGLVIANTTTAPITLLTIIAAIKILSLTIIVLHAFVTWRLVPLVKVNPRFIITWILISLLFLYVF